METVGEGDYYEESFQAQSRGESSAKNGMDLEGEAREVATNGLMEVRVSVSHGSFLNGLEFFRGDQNGFVFTCGL